MTRKRVGRDFFAAHTVAELRDLERLRARGPGPADRADGLRRRRRDRYVPIAWDDAFELVGATLRGLDSPDEAAFYTSGRLGNEATFLYQLWAREFGTNNLPDCSNMCHEASGRALTGVARHRQGHGRPRATGSRPTRSSSSASTRPRTRRGCSPRSPRPTDRGAQIVHINPLVEAAADAHDRPARLRRHGARSSATRDRARSTSRCASAATWRCCAASPRRCSRTAATIPKALDRGVHRALHARASTTTARCARRRRGPSSSASPGVDRGRHPRGRRGLLASPTARIISWCLGLTQHEHGVDTVREIVNLLLLRGNLGREGAGPSPVRGHSNVQGNRTCGIDHRPTEAFLDRLGRGLRDRPAARARPGHGRHASRRCTRGDVKVFVGMGGNFALAAPGHRLHVRGAARAAT